MAKSIPTLDLHGMTKDEAVNAVDRFLVQHSSAPRLRIMTGKGEGKLRAVVSEYLKLGNYPFSVETLPNGKKNEGVLIVFMN